MDEEKELQNRIQRIGALVREVEELSDPAARAKAKELMQAVMELHGEGLERILETIFKSGETGMRIIDDLSKDPLVSNLFVLYGMHPEALDARVGKAIESLRKEFGAQHCGVELLGINGSEVRVRVTTGPHTCGSTAQQLRAAVEDAIYGVAPDVTSLVIEGLEGQAASGFVSVEKLIARPA